MLEFRSFPWGKRPREKTGRSNGVSILEIWSVFSLNLAWTHYVPSGLFPRSFPLVREKTGSCNVVFSLAVFSQNSYEHSKCLKSVFSLRCGLFPTISKIDYAGIPVFSLRKVQWCVHTRNMTGLFPKSSMDTRLDLPVFSPGLFSWSGKRPEVVMLCCP